MNANVAMMEMRRSQSEDERASSSNGARCRAAKGQG